MTVTKMVFVKQRGKNAYHAFATLPGYDPTFGDHDKANDPYWQPWEINKDLHDCMRTYYETEEGKGLMSRYSTKGMIVRARKSRLDLVLIVMSWLFTFIHALHSCK